MVLMFCYLLQLFFKDVLFKLIIFIDLGSYKIWIIWLEKKDNCLMENKRYF